LSFFLYHLLVLTENNICEHGHLCFSAEYGGRQVNARAILANFLGNYYHFGNYFHPFCHVQINGRVFSLILCFFS